MGNFAGSFSFPLTGNIMEDHDKIGAVKESLSALNEAVASVGGTMTYGTEVQERKVGGAKRGRKPGSKNKQAEQTEQDSQPEGTLTGEATVVHGDTADADWHAAAPQTEAA